MSDRDLLLPQYLKLSAVRGRPADGAVRFICYQKDSSDGRRSGVCRPAAPIGSGRPTGV